MDASVLWRSQLGSIENSLPSKPSLSWASSPFAVQGVSKASIRKTGDGLLSVVHAQGHAGLVEAEDLHALWGTSAIGREHHLQLAWLLHIVVRRPVLVSVCMPAPYGRKHQIEWQSGGLRACVGHASSAGKHQLLLTKEAKSSGCLPAYVIMYSEALYRSMYACLHHVTVHVRSCGKQSSAPGWSTAHRQA